MKKMLYLGVIVSMTLMMVACDSGSTYNAANSEVIMLNDDYPDALPVQSQLILGTLKLEDTEHAVDPTQAAELLTLWRAILSLGTSEIAAEGEIEVIVNQILETMRSAQLETISGMELTQEDIFEVTQELGFARGGDLTTEGDPDGNSQDRIFPGGNPGRGLPGGGPGGGGGRPEGFGQDLDPEQIATLRAEREEEASSRNRFSMLLINPLIQMLEERSQS